MGHACSAANSRSSSNGTSRRATSRSTPRSSRRTRQVGGRNPKECHAFVNCFGHRWDHFAAHGSILSETFSNCFRGLAKYVSRNQCNYTTKTRKALGETLLLQTLDTLAKLWHHLVYGPPTRTPNQPLRIRGPRPPPRSHPETRRRHGRAHPGDSLMHHDWAT